VGFASEFEQTVGYHLTKSVSKVLQFDGV